MRITKKFISMVLAVIIFLSVLPINTTAKADEVTYDYTVSSFDDLKNALNNVSINGTKINIFIANDIEITETLYLKGDVALYSNGATLKTSVNPISGQWFASSISYPVTTEHLQKSVEFHNINFDGYNLASTGTNILALWYYSSVVIDGCDFKNAEQVILTEHSSSVEIKNCNFENNNSIQSMIYNNYCSCGETGASSGNLKYENCTFTNNTSNSDLILIAECSSNLTSTVEMDNVNFTNNTSSGNIILYSGPFGTENQNRMVIKNSTFNNVISLNKSNIKMSSKGILELENTTISWDGIADKYAVDCDGTVNFDSSSILTSLFDDENRKIISVNSKYVGLKNSNVIDGTICTSLVTINNDIGQANKYSIYPKNGNQHCQKVITANADLNIENYKNIFDIILDRSNKNYTSDTWKADVLESDNSIEIFKKWYLKLNANGGKYYFSNGTNSSEIASGNNYAFNEAYNLYAMGYKDSINNLPIPSRNGYTFDGYLVTVGTKTGDGELYNSGDYIVNSSAEPSGTKSIHFTAQWKKIYTVTFKDYDGTILKTENVASGSSATAPTNPSRNATAEYTYTFVGWDKDFSNITADTTVTATYSSEINKYNVTFKDYDGTVLDTQAVEYGSSATAPANPSRDATAEYTYTFSGWDKNFDNITENITVTAIYNAVKNKYKVSFFNDTTKLKEENVEYGSSATAPTNPSRESNLKFDYIFNGWDKAFDYITENINIFALFNSKIRSYDYSIIYKCDDIILKKVDGTAEYDSTVSADCLDFEGYELISDVSKQITVKEKDNLIVFNYIKIEAPTPEPIPEPTPEPDVKTVTIKGCMLYSDGSPMANVTLKLHSEMEKTTKTDDFGNYVFENVTTENHELTFLKDGVELGKVNIYVVGDAENKEGSFFVEKSEDDVSFDTNKKNDTYFVNGIMNLKNPDIPKNEEPEPEITTEIPKDEIKPEPTPEPTPIPIPELIVEVPKDEPEPIPESTPIPELIVEIQKNEPTAVPSELPKTGDDMGNITILGVILSLLVGCTILTISKKRAKHEQ